MLPLQVDRKSIEGSLKRLDLIFREICLKIRQFSLYLDTSVVDNFQKQTLRTKKSTYMYSFPISAIYVPT